MKKFNLFTFFILLIITILLPQNSMAASQYEYGTENKENDGWYSIFTGEKILGDNFNFYYFYPSKEISFEAKRNSLTKSTKIHYGIPKNPEQIKGYEENFNWTQITKFDVGSSYSTYNTYTTIKEARCLVFEKDGGLNKRYIKNVKVKILPHTTLTKDGSKKTISLTTALNKEITETISFHSFLTTTTGSLTAEIVEVNNINKDYIELSTTNIAGNNALDKYNEDNYTFQLIYNPKSIEEGSCKIKITNAGVDEQYIDVNLKGTFKFECTESGYTYASLNWDAVNGATHYNLYDNNIKIAENITSTSYNAGNLKPGINHNFTIKAVIDGNESISASKQITLKSFPVLNSVEVPTNTITQTSAVVNWSKGKSEVAKQPITGYNIKLCNETGFCENYTINNAETTTFTLENIIDNTNYTVYVGPRFSDPYGSEKEPIETNDWISTSFTTTSFITEDPFDGAKMYKGVWYRVNLNSEIRINDGYLDDEDKPYEMNLLYPCEPKVDFQINTSSALGIYGDATIKIDEIKTDNWENIHTKSYRGKNQSGTGNTSGHDIKALKFYCSEGNNSNEYVHDIWLTITPHILLKSNKYTSIETETATQTTEAVIDFRTIEIGDSKPINVDFKSFLSKGEIKALLTDTTDCNIFWLNSIRGTKEHHIADNNTLEEINTNDHNFTISFNPTAAGNYDGAIIIKDDQHTVILRLKATCIKKTPEISWINDKYINLGEILSGVASATYGSVKYESLNSDIITIENNILESKTLGTAQIVAIVEENDTWYGAKDTATFNVTDKIIQTIEWNQDFTKLTTTAQLSESGLDLIAKAITRATGEENGNEITYSTTDTLENVIKIIDGKLQIVGPGFAYVTAHQQGNDEYAPTYMTKLVFVRKLSGGCSNFLALEHAGNSYGDMGTGFKWGPYSFTDSLTTIGNTISFRTSKTYDVLGSFDTTGDKIIITDNLGNLVYESTLSDGKDKDNNNKSHIVTNKINREATSLTFTLEGNFQVSISDIQVTPAIYLEADHDAINFTSTEVDLNAIKEVVFDWANQSDYAWATIIDDPEGVFSVDSKTAIFGSPTCGDYGTSTVKVIFSPKKGIDYTAKLAVYVGENIETPLLTIPITGKGAKAKQEIYWLNYPLTTADKEVNIANTTASSQQTITYTILSGNDIAVVNGNNTITILDEGKFTLRAVQEGNDSYLATETIEKEFTTNIGNLIFDNKIGNNNWNTIDNWKPDSRLNLYRNVTPEENINLSIAAPLVINNNTEIVTKNEIYLSTNGRITIAPQGKLKANIINGTTTNNLTLQANDKGSAILVYNNTADNKVKASVQLYSIASSDGLRNGQPGNFKNPKWQYLGIVTEEVAFSTINPDGSSNWIFRWDETSNATSCWAEELSNGSTLSAWTGYCLAQEAANTYNYSGTLINGNHTYPLTYTPENASTDLGNNLLTNSYTAPIDITTISDANFTNAEANIYIYKTGSYLEWKDQTELEGFNPGQIIVIPVNTISALGNEYPRTIASAQAFFVKATNSGASFAINYEENVFGSARKENVMRAKKLSDWSDKSDKSDWSDWSDWSDMSDKSDMSDESDQTFNSLKIQVTSSTSNDRLYLLEHENTTADFDNGYDAEKIFDNPNGPQIYASTAFGCTSINTDKSFDGQYIGFVANNENELYTLSFDIENLHSYEQLWLYDTETELYVDILNQEEYLFYGTTTPNNNRFYVTSINPNAPEVDNTPTNTETTWEDILTEGKPIYLYTTTGQLVATLNAQLSTLNSKLTLNAQLPTGVYIVKSGNKTMKLRIIR